MTAVEAQTLGEATRRPATTTPLVELVQVAPAKWTSAAKVVQGQQRNKTTQVDRHCPRVMLPGTGDRGQGTGDIVNQSNCPRGMSSAGRPANKRPRIKLQKQAVSLHKTPRVT